MKKIILLSLASIIAIALFTGCTNLQSYMEQSNTQQYKSKLG